MGPTVGKVDGSRTPSPAIPPNRISSGGSCCGARTSLAGRQMPVQGGMSSPFSIPRRSPACRCHNSSAKRSRPAAGPTYRCSRSAFRSWSGAEPGHDPAFASRYLKRGFSGGEEEAQQILQHGHARARPRHPRTERLRLDVDALRRSPGDRGSPPRSPGARHPAP